MTTWFVSRHSGAVEWAKRQGVAVDRLVEHLDTAEVRPGDTVIGSLPVNLAAEVCARGAHYLHLSLRVPADLRGVELSADQLEGLGATLEQFDVRPVGLGPETAGATAETQGLHLVSFLGTGNYQPVRYHWPERGGGDEVETPCIAAALAHLTRPAEVVILATRAAEERHGPLVRGAVAHWAPGTSIRFEPIAEGRTPQELWENFHVLHRALASPGGEVVLDITHGFRSLPLFAAAVVAYHRAVDPQARPVTVCYGAFEARDANGRAPIWDLTAVTELADWSGAIRGFLTTGHAEPLAGDASALADRLNRAWASRGKQGPQPRLLQFAKALRRFAGDLATVRVGSLIVGRDCGTKQKPDFDEPSAQALLRALAEAEGDIIRAIPPLEPVLDRIRGRLGPLCTKRLDGPDGARTLAALARLYLELARYPEAAIVLREAWTSRYAPLSACVPSRSFDTELRGEADGAFTNKDPDARDFAKIRNDIEHGGFNDDPQPAESLERRLGEYLARFEAGIR